MRSKVSLHVSPAAPKAQGKRVLSEKAGAASLFRQAEAMQWPEEPVCRKASEEAMQKGRGKLLWQLFRAFFNIGIMTFGGGYAMLPMLEREVVDKHGWSTREQLLSYYAIGQCTPGVIAVNTATFIGYDQAGVLGGVLATVGVITPSLVIILLIATVLAQIAHLPLVASAFAGIRPVVGALIASSVIRLCRTTTRQLWQIALCVAAFVVVALLGQSPVWVVLGAAVLGLLFCGRVVRPEGAQGKEGKA